MITDLAELIQKVARIPAAQAAALVPARPGYYAIWVDDPAHLPNPYAERLRQDSTALIYMGIATKSLRKRLVEQDLYHKSSSTFFRGLGAVLGFRPVKGSLVEMKNKNNYKFNESDTAAIVEWVEKHLVVGVLEETPARHSTETEAIYKMCPILNTDDNPRPCAQLAQLRKECREIARSSI